MITGLVLAVVAGLLFAAAYLSKRRFGALTLAMAAGFIISGYESKNIAGLLLDRQVSLGTVAIPTLVAMAIILLPSVLLFFGGPTYKSAKQRLIGSLLYAVAAILFCLGALEHSLVLVGQEKLVFSYIWQYRQPAMVVLLILAITDMFFIHAIKRRKSAE